MNAVSDRSEKLRAALDRLADPDEDYVSDPAPDREGKVARAIPAEDADGVVAALLQEIGDTVMPATLVLSGGAGHIALAVAGRRMQGVTGGTASILGDDAAVVDAAVDSESEETAKTVGRIVHRLAAGPGPFAISQEIADRPGAEAEPGLAPRALASMWSAGEETGGEPAAAQLAPFDGLVRGGVLRRDGAVVERIGDPALEEPLCDVLDVAWSDFHSERARISRDHTDPSLTCWEQADGPVIAVGIWADTNGVDSVIALTFLAESMADVVAAWTAGPGAPAA